MLNQLFDNTLYLGIAQAVVATLLALTVMLIARWRDIHVERDVVVALVRGIVQIVAVGSVLLFLLRGPNWTGIFALLAMILVGAGMAARRARGIPGALWVSFVGICVGGGLTILLMTWLGVIEFTVSALVPMGSMIIAQAMNTGSLALNRFQAEVESHRGHIETGLALGASPAQTVRPYVQAAVEASLIPRIDALRSLGIVWIPGLMSGMVLSGDDPVHAAIYQFVLIALIFASSGLTSVVCTLLIRSRVFSPAEQLILRPTD